MVGGSDGTPKIYKIFRQSKRVIGDDSNLIRQFPPMPGRVNTVAVSPDGKRIAAGSSSDGSGQVDILNYDFDTTLPEAIKAIEGKVASTRNEQEKKTLEDYLAANVKGIAQAKQREGGNFAVAFQPDGKRVAAAGADGKVRLIDTENGRVVDEFAPAPIGGESSEPAAAAPPVAARSAQPSPAGSAATEESETLPEGSTLTAIEVQPAELQLVSRFEVAQLVVTGTLDSGERVDVTRLVKAKLSADVADITPAGQVRAVADGRATLSLALAGRSCSVALTVSGVSRADHVSFVHDVAPVLSRLGCNQGTCHGSAQGKNGYKLSLRGYDPLFDVRALTDELGARRVNVAAPDSSLMLLKPTGSGPARWRRRFLAGRAVL